MQSIHKAKSLEIKGFLENSLLDWEGKLTSIIFLPFCNFRCPFCHAVELVETPDVLDTVPFEEIQRYLIKVKNWIDGVVICGGEPTIHPEIDEFISRFKAMDLLVKLDTNGSHPEVLRRLIKKGLVDYIAMDIKAPLEKYSEAAGVEINEEKIFESIMIIKEEKIDYEFRTTVVPAFVGKSDIREISKLIAGCRHYALQQFSSLKTLSSEFLNTKTFTKKELEEMAEVARKFIEKVSVRAG